jgi:LmbE family N-acetylglucosaminyl deacetylase
MRSWSTYRKTAKVLREQIGWRRFHKLASPLLAPKLDRIEPGGESHFILVIAPHPDDEAIGCGGAIALHRLRGDTVHVVYTTDGGKPARGAEFDPGQPAKRRKEADLGLEILGGASQDFFDLEDGKGEVSETVSHALASLLQAKRPSRVYVPWALDSHRDHAAAYEMLRRALMAVQLPSESSVWQYEVWTPLLPNRYVPISKVLEKKEQAIRAHASQMRYHDYVISSTGLAHYRGLQGEVDAPAEAYFAVAAAKLEEFSEL